MKFLRTPFLWNTSGRLLLLGHGIQIRKSICTRCTMLNKFGLIIDLMNLNIIKTDELFIFCCIFIIFTRKYGILQTGFTETDLFRSIQPEVFSVKSVLKNLANFSEKKKTLLQTQAYNFPKKGKPLLVFPVNFAKFNRILFFLELLLDCLCSFEKHILPACQWLV